MLCPTTPTVVKTKVVTKKATSRASPTCRNHSLKR
jgi:hypothetical protein